MHERGDGRHHHQHHGGERVDAERPIDLEIGGMIQVNSRMRSSWWPNPTFQSAIQDRTMAIISSEVVMTSAAREPAAGSAGA